MSRGASLRSSIVGFLVKNAQTGETEAVKRGHPRFSSCLCALEMMSMTDLNDLCEEALGDKGRTLEKQAVGMADIEGELHRSVPSSKRIKNILGMVSANRRKAVIGAATGGAVVGGAGAVATGALMNKLRRKSDSNTGVSDPSDPTKQAALEQDEGNNELINLIRSKLVAAESEDA